MAGVVGYHLIIGWRSGVARLPISVLAFEEFERDRSAANFWGIMILDALLFVALLGAALYVGIFGI